MDKVKYKTWNSIRFEFLKKTNMPHPVKSCGYRIGIAWVSPGLSKTNNSISNNFVRRYEVDWRDPKLCWKLEKNPHLLVSSASPSFVKFFKYFTYNRKKTNRAAGFSHWPLTNTFKYKDGRWDVPAICKARFFQTYVEFS